MRFPEIVWRRPLLAAVAMGCMVGSLVGALWPLPAAVAPGLDSGPARLPSRAALERYSESDFATLRDGRLWTGSASGQAQSETVSNWRLVGVVTRPLRAALIEADRKQVRVAIGQPLPDGTILLNVTPEAIEFERNSCAFQRSLYSREDEPIPTAKCPATNTATSPTRSTPSQ